MIVLLALAGVLLLVGVALYELRPDAPRETPSAPQNDDPPPGRG